MLDCSSQDMDHVEDIGIENLGTGGLWDNIRLDFLLLAIGLKQAKNDSVPLFI